MEGAPLDYRLQGVKTNCNYNYEYRKEESIIQYLSRVIKTNSSSGSVGLKMKLKERRRNNTKYKFELNMYSTGSHTKGVATHLFEFKYIIYIIFL